MAHYFDDTSRATGEQDVDDPNEPACKRETERLRVLAEQRLQALKAVEWNEASINGPKLIKAGSADVGRCPWCHFYKPSHATDCRVGIAIAMGGKR